MLGALFLYLAMRTLDWSALSAELANAYWPDFIPALLAVLVYFVVKASRWRLLIRPLATASTRQLLPSVTAGIKSHAYARIAAATGGASGFWRDCEAPIADTHPATVAFAVVADPGQRGALSPFGGTTVTLAASLFYNFLTVVPVLILGFSGLRRAGKILHRHLVS